jgi:hypothetical protein
MVQCEGEVGGAEALTEQLIRPATCRRGWVPWCSGAAAGTSFVPSVQFVALELRPPVKVPYVYIQVTSKAAICSVLTPEMITPG